MGSEWLITGYAVLGFLSLYFFKIFYDKGRGDGRADSTRSLEDRFDPFIFAIQLLCVSIFIFSMLGMSKGVIESYDYCEVVLNTTFVINETEHGGEQHIHTTGHTYINRCFENSNREDENLYKLTYWFMRIIIIIVIIAMIWFLMLFIKKNVLDRLRGGFR